MAVYQNLIAVSGLVCVCFDLGSDYLFILFAFCLRFLFTHERISDQMLRVLDTLANNSDNGSLHIVGARYSENVSLLFYAI